MKEVVVYSTWDEPQAAMAEGLLRAEGIRAVKRDSGLRSSLVITMDGLGEIDILVPEDEFERARDILAARFSDEAGNEQDEERGL